MTAPAPPKRLRQSRLLAVIVREGFGSISALAAQLSVTTQTIRRDLRDLEERGQIRRHHGGAVPARSTGPARSDRRIERLDAKRLIAQAVARLVPARGTVFVDAGTTCGEVAVHIRATAGLIVVTHNLNVAHRLATASRAQVVIAGGEVRGENGAVLSDLAVDLIDRYRFDVAVIGAAGLDTDGTVTDLDPAEIKITRAAMRRARRVLLAVDSSKFGAAAPLRLAEIAEIDVLVTEAAPSPEIARMLEDGGVELVLAEPAEAAVA